MIKVNLSDPQGNVLEIGEDGRIPVKLSGQQSKVPESFNSQCHSFETFNITNKGQANSFTYRPVFQNENSADKSDIVATLEGTSTSYLMQLFRASSTNVNTVSITTSSVPDSILEDDFSNGWTSSTPSKISISYDTSIYHNNFWDTSNSSIKLTLGNNITGVTIYKTISSNWENKNTFSFYVRSSTELEMEIMLSDGINRSIWIFTIDDRDTNIFKQQIFNIDTPNSTSGPLDISAITNISFRILSKGDFTGHYVWLDSFESQIKPLHFHLQLYDFGTNINPSNLNQGTLLTLDNGDTDIEIETTILKTTQRIPLRYGVTNYANQLKFGNYYGLVWTNNGAGTHNIYGNNSEKIYQNGTVHIASSSGDLITLDASPYFTIFAYKECFIRVFYNTTDKDPGHAKIITIIYSTNHRKRVATLENNMELHNRAYVELDFKDIPVFMDGDDLISINYVDDINSEVTEFQFGIDAIYEDFKTWG